MYFCSTAPDASPVDITVTNVRPGVVSLLWSPPPEDKHNGDIIGYVIRVINLEQLMETEDIEIDDITSSIISDLRTFHPYNFSIAARTIAGLGPFSAPLSIVTLHGGTFCSFKRLNSLTHFSGYSSYLPSSCCFLCSFICTNRSHNRKSICYTD